jgi:hypothetical protein
MTAEKSKSNDKPSSPAEKFKPGDEMSGDEMYARAAEDGSARNRCVNESAKVVLGRGLINRPHADVDAQCPLLAGQNGLGADMPWSATNSNRLAAHLA